MTGLSSFAQLNNLLMLGAHGVLGRVTGQGAFQFDLTLTRHLTSYAPAYLKEYEANPDDHRFRIGLIFQSQQQKPWGPETLLFTDSVVRMLYPTSGTNPTTLTAFQQRKRENSVYYGIELLLDYKLKDSPDVPIFLPFLFDRGTTLAHYGTLLGNILTKEDPETPVIEVLNLIGGISNAHGNHELFAALQGYLRKTCVKKDMRKPIEAKILGGSMRMPNRIADPSPLQPAAPRPGNGSAAPRVSNPWGGLDSPWWYHPALHNVTCEKLQKFLQLDKRTDTGHLRFFLPFQKLSPERQITLVKNCPVYTAPAGSVLLEPGTSDRWNLYLLQGELEVTAQDGERKLLSSGTENSRNPIAALKPRKYRVKALSRASFLWVHETMIADLPTCAPASNLRLI